MILDQQNAHALTLRSLASNGRHGISVRFLARGKRESELGALITATAFCRDRSLVGFDQRCADRETETETTELGPGTLFERIEDFGKSIRLNSKPGSDDLYMQLFARLIAIRIINS